MPCWAGFVPVQILLQATGLIAGLLDMSGANDPFWASLDKLGRSLLDDPRGSFELTHGYQPILYNLDGMLRGEKKYRRDVNRLGEFIARGSGRLGLQLPFPVIKHLFSF